MLKLVEGDWLTAPVDLQVDARGLGCPLPILRTKKALANMATGQRVRVLATDPHSRTDFAYFAHQTGHILLLQAEQEGVWIYVLQKR
jgi:tRNA 2-thiouridine synthesizing protein A